MSRKKLAVTIGVKAARYDWVLLTDVDCYPEKATFLDSISRRSISGDCQMVLGYSNFSSDASWPCRKEAGQQAIPAK